MTKKLIIEKVFFELYIIYFLQTFYKPIEYYIKIGYNIFINNEQVKYKEDTTCVIA